MGDAENRSKGKSKVVPVLGWILCHEDTKTYWGSGGIAPRILNLGTRYGGEWPASRPGRLPPGKFLPGIEPLSSSSYPVCIPTELPRHQWESWGMGTKFWSLGMRGGDRLRHLGVGAGIVQQWVLEKQGSWCCPVSIDSRLRSLDDRDSVLRRGNDAIKLPGREAVHLVPRLRMRGAIPPFPQYAFLAWWLIVEEIHLHGLILK
jgi:hypothetical protein